jgi:hypothetical protein
MNARSTPLNQLPNVNSQNVFVNDQQRNMVIQAQNAISQLQMPQNTQQPMENDEDDNTIQEVLNQIHTNNSQDNQYTQQLQQMQQMQQMQQLQQMQMQKESIQQVPQMPPQMMQQVTPQQIPQVIQLPSMTSQPQFDIMAAISHANGGSQSSTNVISDPLEGSNDGGLFGIIKSIADDVKFAAFIFVLFVIVHFIPIDKFLLKYFSIDRIPYYDVLLKGFVAFVAVIVFRKVFACK